MHQYLENKSRICSEMKPVDKRMNDIRGKQTKIDTQVLLLVTESRK